jgi:UDP-N-acetylmuramyl pentapeptide synthase
MERELMKIKKLFKNIVVEDIVGSKDCEITGICSHSKSVAPGNLFIARQGKYIEEAVAAGAVAVLTDRSRNSEKLLSRATSTSFFRRLYRNKWQNHWDLFNQTPFGSFRSALRRDWND